MAESADKAAASAEKAYAAAAEAKPVAPSPKVELAPVKSEAAPVVKSEKAEPKPVPAVRPKPAPSTKKAATKRKPAPKQAAPRNAAAKVVAKSTPTAGKVKKTTVSKTKRSLAPKAKPATVANTKPVPTLTQLKEKIMATAKTPDYTKPFADAVADMQTKAKAAYEKSSAYAGEMTDFAKGNVEAMVESGKILSSGMQTMGKKMVDEAKSAYETATADVKEMASVKSPTELFQLQGKLARRNFDAMVAFSSKAGDDMMKLYTDAFAPISSRVSLAADKLAKAA